MITLNIVNPIADNTVTQQVDELLQYLNAFKYEGTITIGIKQKDEATNDLASKWNQYVAKACVTDEYDSMSEWSPNNGSDVGKLMKSNKLFEDIISNYYNFHDRRESINMLDTFDNVMNYPEYYCNSNTLESYTDDVNYHKFNVEERETNIVEEIEHWEESKLKTDILDIISMYLERNPKFRLDW
jgi:hypothetical protein